MAGALAGYFNIVKRSDVRLGGLASKTLICTIRGDRGFWKTSAEAIFSDFLTGERLVTVLDQRGGFYSGFAAAMQALTISLDPVAADLSAKVTR